MSNIPHDNLMARGKEMQFLVFPSSNKIILNLVYVEINHKIVFYQSNVALNAKEFKKKYKQKDTLFQVLV